MNVKRISRLPKRLADDLKIVRLAENWQALLAAKAANRPFECVLLRNGAVLTSPPEVSLNFLFHEIWIEEFYNAKNYNITDGDTIVDIGGNIGVFALWAATRAKNVSVCSFEPFPANARFFEENVGLSKKKNIRLHEAAVAGSNGTRRLQLDESWILHSLADPGAGDGGIEVECISLDTALSDLEVCNFLKLDCEGGEYEILYSASPETLRKIQRIVCEFNVLDSDMRNGRELGRFLAQKGFAIDQLKMLDGTSGVLRARKK